MLTRSMSTCALILASITGFASVAQACGWYAISVCSKSKGPAERGADKYGGYVVNTDDYENFAGGYYCSVVGPKTKEAARITAKRMRNAGARTAYHKYTC